jgi:hypothetical protein
LSTRCLVSSRRLLGSARVEVRRGEFEFVWKTLALLEKRVIRSRHIISHVGRGHVFARALEKTRALSAPTLPR